MHEKALLNAPKCRVMNGKGIVSDRQRGVECDEKGGKYAKNTAQKTRNGDNLAKLNDTKSCVCARFLARGHFKNKEMHALCWFKGLEKC